MNPMTERARWLSIALALLCLLLSTAATAEAISGQAPATRASGQRAEQRAPPSQYGWNVYKGKMHVLWMNNAPGRFVSRLPQPQGVQPPEHPFLTAQSKNAFEEGALHEILKRSAKFEEFIAALKKAGYTVVVGDGSVW